MMAFYMWLICLIHSMFYAYHKEWEIVNTYFAAQFIILALGEFK